MNWQGHSPDQYVSRGWICRRVDGVWWLIQRGAGKLRARGPFGNLLAAMDAAEGR